VTGHAPAGADDVVGTFLDTFWRAWPVTATFAGVHGLDACLPDWSPEGLDDAAGTWARLVRAARSARGDDAVPALSLPLPRSPEEADLLCAEANAILLTDECASRHGPGTNPVYATGDAVFGLLGVLARYAHTDPVSASDGAADAAARLHGIPELLDGVRRAIGGQPVPGAWRDRARRELAAGRRILGEGIPVWVRQARPETEWAEALYEACGPARAALQAMAEWLDGDVPAAHTRTTAIGVEALERRLRLAHWEPRSTDQLLDDARRRLAEASAEWRAMAAAAHPGGWPGVLQALADGAPHADDYLPRLQRRWDADRGFAARHDLVRWPDEHPVRFVETDRWARPGSASLYYLNYRSPAPYDPRVPHRHQVPYLPDDADARQAVLRGMHGATIALNHVIHHAGLGHHVQNWHAARARTRIGRMAAVDGACRIALPTGGTVAEGWACYAVDLVDELGGLEPLERVVQQHTRVRILCRAVADLSLHAGLWTHAEAAGCFEREAAMPPDAAEAEAIRTALFPGTAIMYWLGTSGLHALRRELGPRYPSLRAFHDAFLSYGAIPVPMIAHLMRGEVA